MTVLVITAPSSAGSHDVRVLVAVAEGARGGEDRVGEPQRPDRTDRSTACGARQPLRDGVTAAAARGRAGAPRDAVRSACRLIRSGSQSRSRASNTGPSVQHIAYSRLPSSDGAIAASNAARPLALRGSGQPRHTPVPHAITDSIARNAGTSLRERPARDRLQHARAARRRAARAAPSSRGASAVEQRDHVAAEAAAAVVGARGAAARRGARAGARASVEPDQRARVARAEQELAAPARARQRVGREQQRRHAAPARDQHRRARALERVAAPERPEHLDRARRRRAAASARVPAPTGA